MLIFPCANTFLITPHFSNHLKKIFRNYPLLARFHKFLNNERNACLTNKAVIPHNWHCCQNTYFIKYFLFKNTVSKFKITLNNNYIELGRSGTSRRLISILWYIHRGIRGNMGTWGIWAKLNINVELVVANFVFSQIAVGTIWEFINGCCEKHTVH